MDATSYRDTVAESSSSADTADTEGSVGIVENPRNRAGRPKKLVKHLRNQPAIHRFLDCNDKEMDNSEHVDDPSAQELELCTAANKEPMEENPSDTDSEELPDVDTLTVGTRRLRVQVRKLPAKETAVTDKHPVRRKRKEQ